MQGDDGAGEGAHDLPPFEIGRTESGRRRRRPSKTDAAATAVSPKGRLGKPGRPFSSLQPALSHPHQPVIAGKLGERRLAHFADIAPGFDGAQRQINCEVRARNGGMVVDVAEKIPGRRCDHGCGRTLAVPFLAGHRRPLTTLSPERQSSPQLDRPEQCVGEGGVTSIRPRHSSPYRLHLRRLTRAI